MATDRRKVMNIDCIMEYLSRNLHTAVRVLTPEGHTEKRICLRADLEDRMNEMLLSELLSLAVSEHPVLVSDDASAAYAVVSAGERLLVLGPVLLTFGNACRRRISCVGYHSDALLLLHPCGSADLLRDALLLHNLFHKKNLTMEEAADVNYLDDQIKYTVQEHFVKIVFENQEQGSRHNPYDQEVREVAAIRNGDPEALKQSWAEDYIGKLGVVAKTHLRNNQNLGIILVTLASRAAMEGGVMPEIAYSFSDSYINKIEEAVSPEAALSLGRQAEYHYACLVQEVKKERTSPETGRNTNSNISLCKDYIFSHLHEKIRISDIAKELYLNPNYLSDLFRKAEGITISGYIFQEKLKLIKNMLIYSRYSYNEIASYLGFSSQSHLGMRFKKSTGMTLHQYRETYGRKEFQDDRHRQKKG